MGKSLYHTSFGSLLSQSHFRKHLLVNVILCVVINFFIDQFQGESKLELQRQNFLNQTSVSEAPNVALLPLSNHPDVIGEVIVFCLISSALYVMSAGALRKDIMDGQSKPVLESCYRDALWKRYLWFSAGAANWKIRLPLFLVQSIVVPAFPIYLALGMCCDYFNGGQQFTEDATMKALLWIAPYKAVGAAWMCTCNYVAAHHRGQPELKTWIVKYEAEAAKKDE